MKRFLLILISLLTAFSCCACSSSNGEIVAEDGTKLAGKQAGNEAVSYSFTYPEEWELFRNDGVIEIQKDCNESDTVIEYATITTLVFTLNDSEMGAKNYWDSQKADTEALFEEFKELDTEETQLDGTVAYKVKYSGKMNGRTYISEQIICCRLGEVFLVTLVAPEQYHDDCTSALYSIRDSFRF